MGLWHSLPHASTGLSAQLFLMVPLPVSSVGVVPRLDDVFYLERHQRVQVRVGDTDASSVSADASSKITANSLCAILSHENGTQERIFNYLCPTRPVGRYVVVQLLGQNDCQCLHVAEVDVYAFPPPF